MLRTNSVQQLGSNILHYATPRKDTSFRWCFFFDPNDNLNYAFIMIEIFDNKIRNARVLLFTKKDGEFSFLLVKEHKGNWGHPGGCKEVEDKTIQETLERELREELGLEPNKYKLIGSIVTDTDYKYTNPASSRFGKTGSFEMFAAEFLGVKSDVVKSSDVEDARWLTQTEAEGLISDDDTRRRFKALVELIQKQS